MRRLIRGFAGRTCIPHCWKSLVTAQIICDSGFAIYIFFVYVFKIWDTLLEENMNTSIIIAKDQSHQGATDTIQQLEKGKHCYSVFSVTTINGDIVCNLSMYCQFIELKRICHHAQIFIMLHGFYSI